MNKRTRNIQLNFADGEKKLTVGNLSVQKNYIHIVIYVYILLGVLGCRLTETRLKDIKQIRSSNLIIF